MTLPITCVKPKRFRLTLRAQLAAAEKQWAEWQARAEAAEAQRDEALKALAEALDLFSGARELCYEVGSDEWAWRIRSLYLLDGCEWNKFPQPLTGPASGPESGA